MVGLLEKGKLAVLVIALALTFMAGVSWLAGGADATVPTADGGYVGVDCTEDPPVARSFRPESYRPADAETACDDAAQSNRQERAGWSLAAVVAWGVGYGAYRLRP